MIDRLIQCYKCKEYYFKNDTHTCPTEWEYLSEDEFGSEPQFWSSVYARCSIEAAQKAAQRYDDGDNYLARHTPNKTILLIRKYGEQKIHRFSVYAEITTQYYVDELEEEEQKEERG
jgi:hypothetical protein